MITYKDPSLRVDSLSKYLLFTPGIVLQRCKGRGDQGLHPVPAGEIPAAERPGTSAERLLAPAQRLLANCLLNGCMCLLAQRLHVLVCSTAAC